MTDKQKIKWQQAKQLWATLDDVPVEDDCIDISWHIFEKGTPIEEIWHWFEETFDISLAKDLMHLD